MKKTMVVLTAVLAVAAGMRMAHADDPATEMRAEDQRMVQTRMANMGPMDTRMLDASPLMTSPVILGEVAAWNEHSVTLNTARGETMRFETDSRTVMPASFRTGEPVKVEFHLMDNGMHHAGRIASVEPGSQDWAHLQQQMAMRDMNRDNAYPGNEASGYLGSNEHGNWDHDRWHHGEHERSGQGAMNEPNGENTSNGMAGGGGEMSQNTTDQNSTTDQTTNQGTSETNATGTSSNEHRHSGELPRTGSNRNWMLVLGIGAFAGAFGQRMLRRSV